MVWSAAFVVVLVASKEFVVNTAIGFGREMTCVCMRQMLHMYDSFAPLFV